MKTKLCTVCGNNATKWDGHIHVDNSDKEEVSAGWCDDHEPSSIFLTEEPIQIDEIDCNPHECYGVYKFDIIIF